MVSILLFLPVVFGIIVLLSNNKIVTRISLLFIPIIYITVSVLEWFGINWIILPGWLNIYFNFDSIGILFLTVLSIVFLASAIYSIFYFDEHNYSNKC